MKGSLRKYMTDFERQAYEDYISRLPEADSFEEVRWLEYRIGLVMEQVLKRYTEEYEKAK